MHRMRSKTNKHENALYPANSDFIGNVMTICWDVSQIQTWCSEEIQPDKVAGCNYQVANSILHQNLQFRWLCASPKFAADIFQLKKFTTETKYITA